MVGAAATTAWAVLSNPTTWQVASSAYGLGSAIDGDKQATEQRVQEKKAIKKEQAKQLGIRKQMIDKQRLQLLGAGDKKYETINTKMGANQANQANGDVVLG
jgi:hypothetical protein